MATEPSLSRGPARVPVALAVSLLSACMLATGVWCLRTPRGR
jgi:hypothetical protein